MEIQLNPNLVCDVLMGEGGEFDAPRDVNKIFHDTELSGSSMEEGGKPR